LATIRNTIDTQFTSRGARAVREETESIGRAQTRLGQSSASAGRSFSAQSSGLGGLVGVYAAAAANVFAISAAFEALNAAAKFQTIIKGTEQLANAVGTSSKSVINSLKDITDGQLTIAEAAKSANIALSAGFNVDQINQLGSLAAKASKTLGRDLTDSFQRLTRGAIKLEPELLDELGIFTRLDPAVNAYAISLGKSVSQLTAFEKRQAFVVGILKDGNNAFKDIDMSGESTQKTFEKLVVSFSDLAIVAGGLLADALVPLAKFLNDSLGNQLILLGAVGTLVFGRLATAVGAFVTGGIANLSIGLNKIATDMATVSTSATAMTARTAAASAAFTGAGALAGSSRAFGSQFKSQLAAGPLSLGQAQQAQPKLVAALKSEKALRSQIRRLQMQGVALTDAQNKKLQQSVSRSRALVVSLRLVRDQISLAGVAANGLTAGLTKAATVAATMGALLGGLLSLLNYVLIAAVAVQLIGKLFGKDIFKELLELYKDFTAESRQAAAGLEELNSKIGQTGSKYIELARTLDAAGLDPDERTVAGLSGKIDDLTGAARKARREIAFLEAQIAKGVLGDPGVGLNFGFFTNQGMNEAENEVARLKGVVENLDDALNILGGSMSQLQGFEDFAKFIGKAKEEVDGLTQSLSRLFIQGKIGISSVQTSADGTMKDFLKTVLPVKAVQGDTLADMTSPFADNYTSFSPPLGQNSAGQIDLTRAFQFKDQSRFLELQTDREGKYTAGSKAFIQAADATSDAYLKIQELFESLALGNISQENAGKQLGILTQRLEEAQKIINKGLGDNTFFNEGTRAQAEAFLNSIGDGIAYVNDRLRNLTEEFIAQEKLFLQLNKQFSGASGFIDTAASTGMIKARTGEIARDEQDIANFRRENFLLLAEQLRKIQLMSPLEQERLGYVSQRKSLDQNLLLIAKASFMETVKFLATTKKQVDAEAQKKQALQDQLDILRLQTAESKRQAQTRLDAARNNFIMSQGSNNFTRNLTGSRIPFPAGTRGDIRGFREPVGPGMNSGNGGALNFEGGQAGINLMKQQQSQMDSMLSRRKKSLDLAKQLRDVSMQTADIERKQRKQAVDSRGAAASGAAGLAVTRAQEAATIIEERSLSTTKEILDARIAVMAAERDAELANIGAAAASAKEEFAQNQEILEEKRKILEAEQKQQIEDTNLAKIAREASLEIVRAERQQLEAAKQLEIDKVKDNKAAIEAQKNLAIKQAEIARANRDVSIQANIDTLTNLKLRIEADDKFLTRYADITKMVLKAMKITFDPEDLYGVGSNNPNQKTPTELMSEVIDGLLSSAGERLELSGDIEDDQKGTATDIAEKDEKARLLRQAQLENELIQLAQINDMKIAEEDRETAFIELAAQDQAAIIAKKLENIDLEKTANQEAFAAKMSELGIEASVAKEAYRLAREAAEFDISQKKRMVQLGKDLAYGISDTLGNAMMKFLTNLQEGKPLIEGIGELFTQMLFDIQQKILKASVIDPITDSVTDSLMGSFGKMAFFGGKAAGGVVHMAEGGQVNSLRDRVPAMLEPGEFVIRKSAAKSIGQSRLGQMNATGAGGMGNVQFNIVNNGAPKEAAQQGPPKIDTDKIVIDVVMRDLNSNGPIRKAMRGG
jgi:hypothetical protein